MAVYLSVKTAVMTSVKGFSSDNKRHCTVIPNNKPIFCLSFWKVGPLSQVLKCLPASGNAGSKGVFLKHPANWMINDFHLSGLLLKNVFTHWLDPKGHRITLLVVIFIFMLCLRSSCSITFHYSGPLAYWKINAFCWPKVVCLRFINWSTGQADVVGGETRANSSAEVAGTKTGLWRVAIRHGYINTVRQGPRIERRAESA